MKIVCIGNSIVNGFPHKRSQSFASLWRQASGHEIINKGENGDVTPNVFARFEKDVVSHKPSAAVILTGTNDFIHQVCTPAEAMEYLKKMALLAKENSIEAILVTPLLIDIPLAEKRWIPDIDYHTVNENLQTLRGLMLEYGVSNGVRIIDVQEFYLRLYGPETAGDFLLDGLHPTIGGQEAIARFLQEQIPEHFVR